MRGSNFVTSLFKSLLFNRKAWKVFVAESFTEHLLWCPISPLPFLKNFKNSLHTTSELLNPTSKTNDVLYVG